MGDFALKSKLLSYYKRKDIQEAIAEASQDKEVVGSFGGKGYAKRPDVIQYPQDVMELVKNGITSFHASEELWHNPLLLTTDMKRSDQDELRKGWDLVLDIDCPFWDFSKIIAYLFIRALKDHGIRSVSCKFSGNKGFHIGVPFEAFPKRVDDVEINRLFPEGPRKIALYLLDYASKRYVKVDNDKIFFGENIKFSFQKIKEITSKGIEELTEMFCSECDRKLGEEKKAKEKQSKCPACGGILTFNREFGYYQCEKCRKIEKYEGEGSTLCSCGSSNYYRKFNPQSIIEVDTILISSRHLYRAPYSFHEKSQLISIPINPDTVLNFDKDGAEPSKVEISKFKFLDRKTARTNEARKLILQAFDFKIKSEEEEDGKVNLKTEFVIPGEALPEEYFPPCIKKMLKGLTDGRKRALFLLTNFMVSVGWSYEEIEKRLDDWNKVNAEPLREVNIKSHLRYHKRNKKKVLPPNCDRTMYYKDMQQCDPDNLCSKIKNPVNYALRKVYWKDKEKEKEKKKQEKKESKKKEAKNTKAEKQES